MSVEGPGAGERARGHGGAGAHLDAPSETRQDRDARPTLNELIRERFVARPRGVGSDVFDFGFGFVIPSTLVAFEWSKGIPELSQVPGLLLVSAPPLALLACLGLGEFCPFPKLWGSILFFSGWGLMLSSAWGILFFGLVLSSHALTNAAAFFAGFSHYRWSERALKLAQKRTRKQ